MFRKAWRFICIYGVGKTLFKIFGRLRPQRRSASSVSGRDLGVIGCGQFAYATIGWAIWRKHGNRFLSCFDVNHDAEQSFAQFYGVPHLAASADDVILNEDVKVIYIASNHASHTDYAVAALKAGKIVYVEKPISVTLNQLGNLHQTQRNTAGKVFAGYNRPFSGAIRRLRTEWEYTNEPLTLSCYINGHVIDESHWYRNPEEGTRVCGNIGHWLDLAVHLLSWGNLPDRWRVTITSANKMIPDDNVAIALVSDRDDLISIVLTSRTEPFEGINESINFQQGEVIAKIDDFRHMSVWKGPRYKSYRFWPKDVGHNLAIIQPFQQQSTREWDEVIKSTLLMLRIKDMTLNGIENAEFSFAEEIARLEALLGSA